MSDCQPGQVSGDATTCAVAQIVDHYANRLNPLADNAVIEAQSCAQRAAGGDLGCDELMNSNALVELSGVLAEYAQHRIRPISAYVDSDTHEYTASQHGQGLNGFCPQGWRVPRIEEAKHIWHAISGAALGAPTPRYHNEPESPAEPDTPIAFWIAQESQCSGGSWLERQTDGSFSRGCYKNETWGYDLELPLACIPDSGPF